jgi:hypothetical protein
MIVVAEPPIARASYHDRGNTAFAGVAERAWLSPWASPRSSADTHGGGMADRPMKVDLV